MNEKNYMLKLSEDAKIIVSKAIEIYSSIEKKELIRVASDKKKRLNSTDKKCGALFVACILYFDETKNIVKNNGSEKMVQKIYEYLGIQLSEIIKLPESKYKDYYNNDFIQLVDNIKSWEDSSKSSRDEPLKAITDSQTILHGLSYEFICGSHIVDYLYSNIGKISPMYCDSKPFGKIEELIVDEEEFANEEEICNPKKSALKKYGDFYTEKKYITNPAIGREKEIRNLMLTLLTPEKSAVILGEAGVGKTAIVEGFAYLIQNKKIPKAFENTKIVKINTSTILSGCMFVGSFEERVEEIIKELIKEKDIILFIDEIHNVMGAGSAQGKDMDLANILKPYLDRGQLRIIGATTFEEYETIKKDSAFKRRFEIINVLEPKEEIVCQILNDTIPKIEEATKVKFNFDIDDRSTIISTIVECSKPSYRVYNDIVNNPDLALTILKKSFAIAALSGSDTVKIENIVESIRNSERIYETARNEFADELLEKFNQKNKAKKISRSNIIPFKTNIKYD